MSELVKKLPSLSKSAPLPYVVISYPAIAALFNDMAEYLGLPKLMRPYKYHPPEAYATYAGHRLGLYEHMEENERCKERTTTAGTRNIPS